MFAVQQPLHWSALGEVMGVPAWKSLSWFLVADGDQAIPPAAERQFAARMGATTVEVSTNHVAMVSTQMRCCSSSRRPPRRCRPQPRVDVSGSIAAWLPAPLRADGGPVRLALYTG
jgi:hypothetical protein